MKTKNCHCCNGSGQEIDSVAMGQELAQVRNRVGLAQCAVAKKMKITSSYLCDLEKGKRYWSDDLIARFRKACGV